MATSGVEAQDKYRSYLHGEEEKNTKWRFGAPPNYDLVNRLFEEGRTKIWPPGSLEEKVQNLVKSWEMEMFHKTCSDDYKSLDPNKYTFSLNGRKAVTLEEKRKLGGGYNSLLQTSLPEKLRGYNPAEETVDSSHRAFVTAFPRGFALEVLRVYSGPPVIVYKFRHWGFMEGAFKGHEPTGEMVELFGMAAFELDEKEKIVKVEFYFDRGELLGGLMQGASLDSSSVEEAATCPFLKNTG
ncbi:pathogen-related protein-like [Juglans microcarpa x Juglans regia]|uniref:pathogen-related protein-like n=1 Tax=Juglans microcarpa x Juglans regia TaxID=2249226 RepID=UPI001B7D966B|nr:pathogen-related protein-like [Juglans microcarpa x Juglans regia]XP_040995913.1 pathogen-related protein-like [Juglans microcarpa x Juglans regia]